ncbi:hypothetical protein HXX76_009304 [Chlamydomonas incerta]|uniref:Guanylate cyclase domain-containing protein n=1 Tax=Chlamydomonas incerta TaxID=51695 RepID=A0A835T0W6_CHLIN|nr:hypothetical protein HXX76_009304 [Chlamydomonas incerta]|eukprot:KAG2431809.1 hypothetical protein HXX76_009304 [Chlamydomonas incerta]
MSREFVFNLAGRGVVFQDIGNITRGPIAAFNSCIALAASGNTETKIVKWMLYPGWQGSAVFDLMRYSSRILKLTKYSFLYPDTLPPPAAMVTPDDLDAQLRTSKSNYTIVSQDVSGMPLATFLADPEVHSERLTTMPIFHDIPENFCAEPLAPIGPLFPRTFLFTVFRADIMSALAAAGLIPGGTGPLNEWVEVLKLLETYASLVRQQQADPASLPSGVPNPLPPFPVCINTDALCGRQTDLLAAIAASVIQTRGTQQGYFLDLSLQPPAAVPHFNSTAWRYAASVLAALMRHNPSDADQTAATKVTGGLDGTGPGAHKCHALAQNFNIGRCLLQFEFDIELFMGTNFAAVNKPGQYGVAPLPGSRVVAAPPGYDAAAATGAAAASAASISADVERFGLLDGEGLVPCTDELCGLSHNHDLLYLQPTLEGAEAAAAASEAAAALAAGRNVSSSSSGSKHIDTGDSPLPVYAERERVAAARLKANLGAAVLPPLVNRAAYSVALDQVFSVRYQGAAVETASLGDMVAMQQWSVQGLSSTRARRQAATDTLRQALGYQTVTGNSSVHGCNEYANWDWWRLFAPSQRNATTAAAHHRRQRQLLLDAAPTGGAAGARNLSFLYADWAPIAADVGASGGSRDAAGFGGLYLHALWHATHSPNMAADMQSPSSINFFRYALDHGSMLLLPPNRSYNGSYSRIDEMIPATPAAVDAALGLMDRLWGLAIAAQGNATVRRTYEAAIAAPEWQPPPVDNSGLNAGEVAAVAASVAVFVALVLVLASVLVLAELRRRRRRRNRDMLGRVLAPREGPDTTLLITDVQNSTVLWEGLPVAVMDVVLKLHHGIIRAVLSEHDGYESATEGDSFILAFATPQSAIDFATSCQVALLKADWPPALLDHPDGAPVLVLSPHDPRDAHHATATLAALGLVSPSRMLSSRHMSGSGVHKRSSMPGGGGGGGSGIGVERSEGMPKLQLHQGRASLKAILPVSAFGSVMGGGGSSSCKEITMSQGRASSAFTAESSSGIGASAPVVPRRTLAALRPSSLGGVGLGSGPQFQFLTQPPPPPQAAAAAGEAAVASAVDAAAAGAAIESPFTAAGAPATAASAGRPGGADSMPGRGTDTGIGMGWVSGSGAAALFPGGQGGGGGGSGVVVDAFGIATGTCAWSELMGAAFPVMPLDTPEGRRLAMLIGAGGGGGGGGGGGAAGGSRRGMSAGSRSLGGDAGDEDGEEGHRRAPTGLEEVFGSMTAAGSQVLHAEGWRPGPHAPCVHLPDGRLALVAYRGMRVRMGLHTGLDEPEAISFNKVASAYAYKGHFAELAKLVSDAAPGGLISLSAAAFARLRNTRPATGSGSSTAADKADAAAAAAAAAERAEQANEYLGAGDEEAGGAAAAHHSATTVVKDSVSSFFSGIKQMFGTRRAAAEAAAAAAAAASRGAVIVFAGMHVLSSDPKPKAKQAAAAAPAPPPRAGGAPGMSGRHRLGSRLRSGVSAADGVGSPTVALALGGPVAEATLAPEQASDDSANELGAGAGALVAGGAGGTAAAAAGGAARLHAQAPAQPQPQSPQAAAPGGAQPNGRHSQQLQHHHRHYGRSADRRVMADMIAEALVEAASATQSAIAAGGDDSGAGTGAANGHDADAAPPASPPPRRRRHAGELLALMQPESAELIFLAVHPSLVCRLALAAPLRVVRQCSLGSLAAPVRRVTVVFMKVAGAALLLQDLPGPAARALDAFLRLAAGLLGAAGGYLVEGGDGLVLAVFGSAAAAVRWATDTVAALKRYPWEEALLAHELCAEELAMGGAVAASHTGSMVTGAMYGPAAGGGGGGAAGTPPQQSHLPHSFTLQRSRTLPIMQAGPRIKCGLDVGEVTHTLTEASGRLSYRGRPMNRAARIAGISAAGQVLVSGDTWAAACEDDASMAHSYSGISLGAIPLKGVAQPIEIVEVVMETEQ